MFIAPCRMVPNFSISLLSSVRSCLYSCDELLLLPLRPSFFLFSLSATRTPGRIAPGTSLRNIDREERAQHYTSHILYFLHLDLDLLRVLDSTSLRVKIEIRGGDFFHLLHLSPFPPRCFNLNT